LISGDGRDSSAVLLPKHGKRRCRFDGGLPANLADDRLSYKFFQNDKPANALNQLLLTEELI
jgi:hypothetical protein